jgi:hypothetical protein
MLPVPGCGHRGSLQIPEIGSLKPAKILVPFGICKRTVTCESTPNAQFARNLKIRLRCGHFQSLLPLLALKKQNMEAIDVQLQLPFSFLPASAPAGRLRHYHEKETISEERTHRHQGLRAYQKTNPKRTRLHGHPHPRPARGSAPVALLKEYSKMYKRKNEPKTVNRTFSQPPAQCVLKQTALLGLSHRAVASKSGEGGSKESINAKTNPVAICEQ